MGYHRIYPVTSKGATTDRDAQDVLAYKGHSDEEAEEETKPEQFGSGGEQVQNLGEEVQQEVSMETEAIPTTAVPMDPGRIFNDNTLLSDLMPGAGGAASSASVERASKRPEEFEGATQPKAPRLDEPAVPEPKVKAALTDVRMVHNVEVAVSDEIGLGTSRHLTRVSLTSRQNYNVEKEKDHPRCPRSTLNQLDSDAAGRDHEDDFNPIKPCSPDPATIPPEQLVDTTLVNDWRFRDGVWKRRCRIVAREYREGQANEEQYSPTSGFPSVRLLLVL